MNTHRDPRELAVVLLSRSSCGEQHAAVLSDDHGIFSWGWNHARSSGGFHAEEHAVERANKARLRGAMLTIAGMREKNGNWLCARPCERKKPVSRSVRKHSCMELLKKHGIKKV